MCAGVFFDETGKVSDLVTLTVTEKDARISLFPYGDPFICDTFLARIEALRREEDSGFTVSRGMTNRLA